MIVRAHGREVDPQSAIAAPAARSSLFASNPDGLHPVQWIIWARTSPRLARVLEASVCLPHSSGVLARAQWPHAFLHAPDWSAVAKGLAQAEAESEPGESRQRIARARLARSIAGETGWSTLDGTYWSALIEPIPQSLSLEQRLLPAPKGIDDGCHWCVALADVILGSQSAPRAPSTEQAHAWWRERLAPEVWRRIEADAEWFANSEGPSATEVPAPILSLAASLWAERQHASRLERIVSALGAPNPEAFLEQILRVMVDILGAPAGLWLDLDSGLGRTMGNGVEQRANGPRHEFERLLPPEWRSSRWLVDTAGDRLGCVYYGAAAREAALDGWRERLTQACRQATAAFRLRRDHARLTAYAEAFESRSRERLPRELEAAIAEFSAGAGHEINNPLGAMKGCIEQLQRGEVEPDRRQLLQKMSGQVDRIRRMIRDLQIIGRAVPRAHQTVMVAAALEEACAAVRSRRRASRVTLLPIEASLAVLGHPEEVARMAAELIRNGVEAAGERGWVSVAARRQGPWVEIEVRDSGPGFTAEARRHAFTPFYSGRQAGRGLGMGLPVVAKLAREHGGMVILGAERPTSVRLRFPALTAADTPRRESPEPT